jgi:hypothetical protein
LAISPPQPNLSFVHENFPPAAAGVNSSFFHFNVSGCPWQGTKGEIFRHSSEVRRGGSGKAEKGLRPSKGAYFQALPERFWSMVCKSSTKKRRITALEIEYGVLADPEQHRHSRFYFREPLRFKSKN